MVKFLKLIHLIFISLLLLSYGCSKKKEGDSLKITKFSPDLPASISVGERLIVTVDYDINSVEEAQIFVRPYTNGRGTPGYSAHGCRPIEKSKGVMKGYFTFDEPAIVDEVRVKMVNAKDQSHICTSISKKISAQWVVNQESASADHELMKPTQKQFTGDRLNITKFSPDLPASISVGERLIVTVDYDINSVEEAQIFVHPYTNGRGTPGCRSSGCRPIEKGKGVMKSYFYFNEPTIVDEVRVKMVNAKDQSHICTSISKEISAQWLVNP